MQKKLSRVDKYQNGNAIVLVVISIAILTALGLGLLSASQGARHLATKQRNEAISVLAAEAGYEEVIFWMSQQEDVAYIMQTGGGSYSNSLSFPDGKCNYEISFYSFLKSRPAYQIVSKGSSGIFTRTIDTIVFQEVSGWDMGKCRVPNSSSSTTPVYFADSEIIDMPLHINELGDSPDNRDIYITGKPKFIQAVTVGEKRYTKGGSDKYNSVLDSFKGGISFDQPNSRVTDISSIAKKMERFKGNTKNAYKFKPNANASITNPLPAVQLEFFVNNKGIGKVRITKNCTIRGFKQNSDKKTWDYKIKDGSGGDTYERYYIYSYHLIPENAVQTNERITRNITKTYVTQKIAGMESEPGGQIYVDGNVVIGGNRTGHSNGQVVKGKITVVATGNIWIADSILFDGPHDSDGMPSADNLNALGLIAKGVVKVVDPGMSDYSYVDGSPDVPSGFVYEPIGIPDSGQSNDSYKRYLPDPMVIEAAVTIGGGGWGAENVRRGSYGGRKEANGNQDKLIVRGAVTEAVRGVVGLVGSDGYIKQYYFDKRLREGILPGDIWLKSKFIPAPGGWDDYRDVR